jgi:hypothetical protein
MGLFKKIKKAVKNPVKAVKSVAAAAIKNPVRASMAVGSLGLSEVARAAPIVGDPFKKVQSLASTGYVAAANAYTGGAYGQAGQLGLSIVEPPRGDNMGFNIGQFLTGASSILSGGSNPYASELGGAAQLASSFFPQPTAYPAIYSQPQTYPVMSKVPQIAGSVGGAIARSGAAVGRGFFNKYPNLATGMQMLRNQGRNIKRSQLYSMMRRFGPEMLITGGILSAAAISELMVAGPGHRRMNPGNVKALRRSLRRLESFHGLCARADKLRRPSRRKSAGKSCGTQFVRQG